MTAKRRRLRLLLLQLAALCLLQVASVDLPFGDVNVLSLTDTHSWIAGHNTAKEPLNVDYGDVLSFYERLKSHCNEHNMDLWFVVNGDWNDGTGEPIECIYLKMVRFVTYACFMNL